MQESGRRFRWGENEMFAILGAAVVIAALCAFAPQFFTRRDGPVRIKCLSNLKQIGLAFRMYANDYDGYWPLGDDWCLVLQPYIKNKGILKCPDLPDEQWGYAYNSRLVGICEEDLKNPVDVVAVFDAKPGFGRRVGGAELVDARHNGGANILFADGHTAGQVDPKRLIWSPIIQSEPHDDGG